MTSSAETTDDDRISSDAALMTLNERLAEGEPPQEIYDALPELLRRAGFEVVPPASQPDRSITDAYLDQEAKTGNRDEEERTNLPWPRVDLERFPGQFKVWRIGERNSARDRDVEREVETYVPLAALTEALSTLNTIRSWCDDPPTEMTGGWLLASQVADLIDAAPKGGA
jgi:hypothetical protein